MPITNGLGSKQCKEDRRQKLALSTVEGTEGRMGKPGNRDNRVQMIRESEDRWQKTEGRRQETVNRNMTNKDDRDF